MTKSKLIFLGLWLLAVPLTASSATYTNLFPVTTNAQFQDVSPKASVNVQTNQLAKVIYARFSNPGARLNLKLGEAKFQYHAFDLAGTNSSLGYYGPAGPPIVAGPAVIELDAGIGNAGYFYCVVEITDNNPSFVPSNAVVIPSDANGPVKVVLESSADLITWTAALPGNLRGLDPKAIRRGRAIETRLRWGPVD